MQALIDPKERIKQLIDLASASVGGQNKLARNIGYSSAELSQWHTATRPCPIEAQALMAQVAGLEPSEVVAYAMIEKHADTPRGEKLASAMGKRLGAIGVAASGAIYASGDSASEYLTRCIDVLSSSPLAVRLLSYIIGSN